ncbi:hypothetical protein PRIPAC_92589 [Pristionchus pacificus]|uniref:Uncharacterized protein n=1 Tax=Pristionchus pacificus TaxID=54126 RepID=A0A454XT82_PRIPA|nr:hypothetical protein PRIPAC_92589 [Pristionchus pacificus]|eukprot:PDM62719.1 hypothetical protein PRIPAC_49934 [Pristionchus pacificus]
MGKVKKGKSALSGSSASSAGPSTSARPVDSEGKVKKSRPNNFQRAKAIFDKIQQDKQDAKEHKQQEREKREKAMDKYNKNKQKMNRALKKKNRKGQPNLGAQVAVILEKLQGKK